MAQQRATIVAHALDDVRIDLTPSRERREPVEAPSESLVPSPSTETRSFYPNPLPVDGSIETVLKEFVSLRAAGKRERMVPYPVRFPVADIAELESLREERGIIPAQFIRDAVKVCLELLRRS